ncbi:glutathione transferase GstA [Geminicoccus flavidas]|uniref:glutathione transferase GstA n=1 Tax=Geminicoccus flavidas TaxID=2506407 RepID=UPI00135A61EE|nr:glutathione transferase GstA [Geminicoccus flavidas]
MQLYYAPGACSLAAHITAREAGVPVDLVKVDIPTGRLEDGREFRQVNPRGYVPALVLDDGELVTEAQVVVQYLADLVPTSGLFPPPGTRDRLRVQEWLGYVATELHKPLGSLWDPSTPEAWRGKVREWLPVRFAELDAHLATRPFLVGSGFTVADAYLFVILSWTRYLSIDLSPYPALEAFLARVAERPKVRQALAEEGLGGGAEPV